MVALDHFEATFWHMAVILVHLGSFGGHSGVALGHFGALGSFCAWDAYMCGPDGAEN